MAARSRAPEELCDADARRRIRDDLGATLFVEAAAGTGKTSALVSRIVNLLRSGHGSLDRIAAVTFTEKAAGEMKLRLRAEIESARVDADMTESERGALEQALSQLELARIGTIHAFCGDLLHERPVEARVDPLFEVAPEDESERLLDQTFDAWFQQALAEPGEAVRRVLRRRPRGRFRVGPREQLRRALGNLVEHRDFPAPWRREPLDREARIDALMEELERVGARRRARTTGWAATWPSWRASTRRPHCASRCAAATTTGSRPSCGSWRARRAPTGTGAARRGARSRTACREKR
jgi:ATP-dependent exoDNAse (exonuclease V) beta subunit